jgi:hypothetical protein
MSDYKRASRSWKVLANSRAYYDQTNIRAQPKHFYIKYMESAWWNVLCKLRITTLTPHVSYAVG